MHSEQGSGPPVVFVHGNLSTRRTWGPVLAAMPADLRAISYDLRGHAPSAKPFGDPGMEDFVADLDELRAALELPPMVLVGQSFGAFIAAAYAARYPGRVAGLLLIAAPAGRRPEEKAVAAQLVARFRAEGVMAVMQGLVAAWYTDAFRQRNPDAVDQRLAQIRALDEAVSIRTYELYNAFELLDIAADIRCPTTVMTGEFARGCGPEALSALAGRIGHATGVLLPQLKNGVPTEAPGAIVAAIRQLAGDR
jgi:3-oxoadipate enol-lactonase